jgi:LL-diaminopimelate aminotransferase
MDIEFSDRMKRLPPWFFTEIEKLIIEKEAKGADIISLSIGDPDLPPPQFIRDALAEEAADPENHYYPYSRGEYYFREAIAEWCKKRFGLDLDPDSEVVALIGSKDGLVNIPRAFINPGDGVLVPDPAYPGYANGGALLNDGRPILMPLLEENDYKPDFDAMSDEDARMMFLNYPNNPTTATVDKSFLEQVVDFARENNLIVCYDNAYSEMTFDGYKAPSILEVDGGMEVAIEFHSFSKTFNMTGDRIGFAVGNEKLVRGLISVKTQIDSGAPEYIQKAAKKALESYSGHEPPEHVKKLNETYKERRDLFISALNSMGLKCEKPLATFYVWLNCNCDSMDLARKLIDIDVLATPGIGLGKYGENYMRFALTQPKERIEEACERMRKVLEDL